MTSSQIVQKPLPKKPEIIVAADCVVFDDDGRLLLIRRKYTPFQGMYALPGGMIEVDETAEEAAKRELKEETGIEADSLTLLGVYSKPGRDPRGHSISIAYLVKSKNGTLQAGDDASSAEFIKDWDKLQLAFDHAEIARDALTLSEK